MIRQQVLEPVSDAAELASIDETIGWLTIALAAGDPSGTIAMALSKLRDERDTVSKRPHRGLVDYDPRVHG